MTKQEALALFRLEHVANNVLVGIAREMVSNFVVTGVICNEHGDGVVVRVDPKARPLVTGRSLRAVCAAVQQHSGRLFAIRVTEAE